MFGKLFNPSKALLWCRGGIFWCIMSENRSSCLGCSLIHDPKNGIGDEYVGYVPGKTPAARHGRFGKKKFDSIRFAMFFDSIRFDTIILAIQIFFN